MKNKSRIPLNGGRVVSNSGGVVKSSTRRDR